MHIPVVTLPMLHPGQAEAFYKTVEHDYVAIRCGRRWGKTQLIETIACDAVCKGWPVGIFAPDYKILSETYYEMLTMLQPITVSASRIDGVIRCTTGGRVDFWTLENERAGRSRKYKKVLIDEAAFGKANVMQIWETAIKPTLIDLSGTCLVASNTNGSDPANFLYQICNNPKYGFVEYQAPTHSNPYLPLRQAHETDDEYQARRKFEMDKLQASNHPLVYQQEYLAEFVDWSGFAFFEKEKLLVNGDPVELPTSCDQVFAVIDSAIKTGSENDGTGVSYWAYTERHPIPLICLDWDLVQIEGASLEVWIPSVFERLESYAKQCGARMGSQGAWIEDAASGSILLQQCANRGLPAQALPAAMTAAGKDARAINASGPVYRGLVKFVRTAWDKVTTFKGVTRNHMASQVFGFRVGDKDATKRADDLLDTFTYAVSISLCDSEGIS
jgi:hypothetical protein